MHNSSHTCSKTLSIIAVVLIKNLTMALKVPSKYNYWKIL